MNFADNFTAADCRARVLHNVDASLFPMAVACIEAAADDEIRTCSFEATNSESDANLLVDVLKDRGFQAKVVDMGRGDPDYLADLEFRYHIHVAW